jgi:hypothetical protein
METKNFLPFETNFYPIVSSHWPTSGKVILGSFSSESIVVYQAYNSVISEWAVNHKTMAGCPEFSLARMTWLKTNFLWMMYRSGWATKVNQERILAITIKRSGFEEILSNIYGDDDDVRLQWDPDHDPYGAKVMERRAIQLGLRRKILQKFLHEWILDIHDITDFVQEQYQFVKDQNLTMLKVPAEKVYVIENEDLRKRIGSDS